MEAIIKDIQSRKNEIQSSITAVFKTHMKITDWDVPEADDKQAAQLIVDLMQEQLDQIKADIESGNYNNY